MFIELRLRLNAVWRTTPDKHFRSRGVRHTGFFTLSPVPASASLTHRRLGTKAATGRARLAHVAPTALAPVLQPVLGRAAKPNGANGAATAGGGIGGERPCRRIVSVKGTMGRRNRRESEPLAPNNVRADASAFMGNYIRKRSGQPDETAPAVPGRPLRT